MVFRRPVREVSARFGILVCMTLPKRYIVLLLFVGCSAPFLYLLLEVLYHVFLLFTDGGIEDVGAWGAAIFFSVVGGLALLIGGSATGLVVCKRSGKRELAAGFLYSLYFCLMLVIAAVVAWYLM